MRLGFSFRETLEGRYWRLDAPLEERALRLVLEPRADDVRRFARERVWSVGGTVDAEGLATAQAVEGTLAFRLPGERRLPYRVRFRGDDGRDYELSGQKEWLGVAPVASLTHLAATLYDGGGAEIGRAEVAFDLRRDGGALVRSFRLRGGW